LEPGGDVDGVAGHEGLALTRDDAAGVDADPELRAAELRGRAYGTQRVVLVGLRHAEDRHDGVADELLDAAAVAPQRGARLGEPLVLVRPHRRGVAGLAERGRADGVREEDGDDLAHLARRLGGDERLTTGQTEPRALRVLLAAVQTDDHKRGRPTQASAGTIRTRRPPSTRPSETACSSPASSAAVSRGT